MSDIDPNDTSIASLTNYNCLIIIYGVRFCVVCQERDLVMEVENNVTKYVSY